MDNSPKPSCVDISPPLLTGLQLLSRRALVLWIQGPSGGKFKKYLYPDNSSLTWWCPSSGAATPASCPAPSSLTQSWPSSPLSRRPLNVTIGGQGLKWIISRRRWYFGWQTCLGVVSHCPIPLYKSPGELKTYEWKYYSGSLQVSQFYYWSQLSSCSFDTLSLV